MRSFLKLFLVALGFATVDLIWLIKPAAEPTQRAAFHWSGDVNGLYLAVIFDVLILTSILLALLLLARKPGKPRIAIWTAFFLWLPWVFYIDTCALLHRRIFHRPSLALFWGAFLVTSWIVIRSRPASGPLFERVLSVGATIMVFMGLFGAFLICRLSWYDIEVHFMEAHLRLHAQASPVPQSHRVIWIVFDELSYWQLFEQRFPGLQVPAFDALAAQSTVFTNVVPVDTQTEIVFPGLMTGKSVDDIRTSPSKRFLLHNTGTHQWQPFDQHDTVFQDALNAGHSTGVAGWYNPYCEILPAVLDHCFWVSRMSISTLMAMNGRLIDNMVAPLQLVRYFFLTVGPSRFQRRFPDPAPGPIEKYMRQRDLAEIQSAADKLLRDRSVGFLLLHLPVPHPGGIYSRSEGKLEASGSYIDNLALADRCMAEIRQTLEASGQWDSSTVVVMGDHGWRTVQVWARNTVYSDWTREDIVASDHGRYDPRPAYIVKLPGQTSGYRINTPFHAVNTRKLFDGVLNHSIATPEQLASWAQAAR
jgi:hypothetical protein